MILQTEDHTANALLEKGHIEVDQQADAFSGQA
jgi:hypothetical protein